MLIVEEIGVIEVCGANVLEVRMLDALVDDIGIVLEEIERVGIDGVVDVDIVVDGVVGVNVLVDKVDVSVLAD